MVFFFSKVVNFGIIGLIIYNILFNRLLIIRVFVIFLFCLCIGFRGVYINFFVDCLDFILFYYYYRFRGFF